MPTGIQLDLEHPSWMDAPPAKLHGVACATFEPEGAAHDGTEKPFSTYPLRFIRPGRSVLRWNWLPDQQAMPELPVAGDVIRFGSARCAIAGVSVETTRFSEFAASSPVEAVRFVFHTPTSFASDGRRQPILDPALVLTSIARRWNAHAGIEIPSELLRELRECVRLDRWSASTEEIDTGKPGRMVGFVGEADMSLPDGVTPSVGAIFAALARSAEFTGVGVLCTYGMGTTTAEPL